LTAVIRESPAAARGSERATKFCCGMILARLRVRRVASCTDGRIVRGMSTLGDHN